MAISKDGVDITNRFFEAIDMLIAQKKIRGLGTIANRYDINRWYLTTIKNNPDQAMLKPELLVPLVRDFNVSAEWLITGRGDVFKKQTLLK